MFRDPLRQLDTIVDRAVQEFFVHIHIERFEHGGDPVRSELFAEFEAEVVERSEIVRLRVKERRDSGAEDEPFRAD